MVEEAGLERAGQVCFLSGLTKVALLSVQFHLIVWLFFNKYMNGRFWILNILERLTTYGAH